MSQKLTDEQILQIGNLTSRGIPLADAKKRVLSAKSHTTSGGNVQPPAPPAPTPEEVKTNLAAEITALGGTPPEDGASVEKFQEVLAEAKTNAEGNNGGGEGQPSASAPENGGGEGQNNGADDASDLM